MAVPTDADRLTRLLDAGRALVAEVDLDAVLYRLLDTARELTGAHYAAIGVLDNAVADKKLKKRIAELVIPPAWQDVWICSTDNGHVLATGIDEKRRKQ